MITKQIAGLLYSFSYQLQDNEGNVYEIILVNQKSFTVRYPETNKMILFEEIGSTYKILAREMDLTKPIEGVGVPIVELCKQEYGSIYYPDDYDECNLSDLELHIIALSKNFCTLSYRISLWLYTNHFNFFPEGTTTKLI